MSAHTWFQTDLDEPEVHPMAGGRAALFTARAPEKEGGNQDSAGLVAVGEDAGVLLVADGAGGMPAGHEASRTAIETLVGAVRAVSDPGQLRTAILDGIEAANLAIKGLGNGSATTLAVVEVVGRAVRSYHVGDSPIFVFGQRGRVKLQTVAHSPVGYAVESGLLDEADAVHHEDRYLVSNLLGTAEMRIEIGPVLKLADRDTLVVSSDGLADNFLVDEIVERTRTGPLLRRARELAGECRARMQDPTGDHPSHRDDLTFFLYRPTPPSRRRGSKT